MGRPPSHRLPMATAFVVLVRDPKQQTFNWCPAIADTPMQAMAAVGQALTNNGQAECMIVGAFTRDQVKSSEALFDQMDQILRQQG